MNLAALEAQAREILERYDEPRAAMLPLLWLVQEKCGHIPAEAELWVGRLLGLRSRTSARWFRSIRC